jgi:hypothetical protein
VDQQFEITQIRELKFANTAQPCPIHEVRASQLLKRLLGFLILGCVNIDIIYTLVISE